MTQKNILVMGSGIVGSLIAHEFLKNKNNHVTIMDNNADALEQYRNYSNAEVWCRDISDINSLKSFLELQKYDLAMGALPSWLGYKTMKTVIEAKIPYYVDISFMEEDCFNSLTDLAKENGVTCIMDCGFAPGLSNILAMVAANIIKNMKGDKEIEIYAGGLPKYPQKELLDYKAAFSPYDVLAEYTRPARILKNGEVKSLEAMSNLDYRFFLGLPNEFETFITDGLRSLLETLPKNINASERTVRYKGHANAISMLKNIGLLSQEKIHLASCSIHTLVKPIDFLASLLFPKWKYEKEEEDFSILCVEAKVNEKCIVEWIIIDRPQDDFKSMSRMTGYPAVFVGNMLLNKEIEMPRGVHPPEILAHNDKAVSLLFRSLEVMGIVYVGSHKLG